MSQFLPGFEMTSFLGIGGPPGMPRPLVDRINAEVRKALNDPDTKKRFADLGGEARGGTPEEMRAYVEAEIAKWKRLVDSRRIEKQ